MRENYERLAIIIRYICHIFFNDECDSGIGDRDLEYYWCDYIE